MYYKIQGKFQLGVGKKVNLECLHNTAQIFMCYTLPYIPKLVFPQKYSYPIRNYSNAHTGLYANGTTQELPGHTTGTCGIFQVRCRPAPCIYTNCFAQTMQGFVRPLNIIPHLSHTPQSVIGALGVCYGYITLYVVPTI